MASERKVKQQEIPFILDGHTIVKSVTKHTTCSDVINKLPNLSCPLAVYESVDGIEKELPAKSKLLKVLRTHGPNKTVEFVIRKTGLSTKESKSTHKLFSGKKRCEKRSANDVQRLSRDTLKQVSDLACYIRYQKIKVEALTKKSEGKVHRSEQDKLMRRLSSQASVNSMDAFLAKADLNEMARFLSFCGGVTAEKLGQKVDRGESTNSGGQTEEMLNSKDETTTSGSKINSQTIQNSLKSMKLGLKQRYTSKTKVLRTTSTGTISSADTGYQSNGSEEATDVSEVSAPLKEQSACHLPMRYAFPENDFQNVPRHSTPINFNRSQKRRSDDNDTFTGDSTLTQGTLEHFDEADGKNVILQKFMADQTMPIGKDDHTGSEVKRRRTDRHSMPVFNTQKDKCRFLWDKFCDSDSDTDSESSEPCDSLDVAFNDGSTDTDRTNQFRPRTLRRESAISNLQRFSLLTRDTGVETIDSTSGFDYSFDCSFPRMDESQSGEFSLDFSYSFDESDSDAFKTLC